MSNVVRIRPEMLAKALGDEGRRVKAAMITASRRAARRFQAHVVDRVDKLGITDTGAFKRSFKVRNTRGGAEMYSDYPIAGIIELGARPHPVSKEGREAIARWAKRKLQVDHQTALRIAFVTAQKIKEHGQKPTYVVRNSLPKAQAFFGQEMVRILNNRTSRAT